MKTMHSFEEIIASVNKGIEEGLISAQAGNYVKIIEPPESTTLTDEQIALINEGVFINGEFLGFKNPILFPTGDNGGLIMGCKKSTPLDVGSIQAYFINSETNQIRVVSNGLSINYANGYIVDITGGWIQLKASERLVINNKTFPSYPTDNTKQYKLVFKTDGTMAWEEDV